ncbi:MAG: 50S ribosomal protein L1, partial [Pelagibacteraceae bacterium]
PNPKLGTVSTNIKKSVQDIKSGLIEIKHDKDGNIGASVGRKSFSTENLVNNIKHLVDFIKKEKPDTMKGEFIKNIFVTSTMGVSVKLNSKSI